MPTNLTKTNYIPATSMRIYFLIFFSTIFLTTTAQEPKPPTYWGIHFGYGTQQTAPFHLLDYDFEQGHVLGQLGLKNIVLKKLHITLLAEGGYYYAQHQLINKWFTTTEFFSDFPDDFQQSMLQKKSIHQLVFHAAIELSHLITPKTQLFGYAAIGPMWTSQQTERLAKGIAFSDNIGVGLKFKLYQNMWLSNLVVLRHESNADLQFPNSGHNTLGVRIGVVFNLIDPQTVVRQPLNLPKP